MPAKMIPAGTADKPAKCIRLELVTFTSTPSRCRTCATLAGTRMATDALPRHVTAAGPNNLPAPTTRFIGREQQIDDIRRLLGSSRLLTLTGSGGCGKTRLAVRVAADVS